MLFNLCARMGQAYSEGYVPFGQRNDFSNKLFSAWDYHINNGKVAEFKRKIMKKHFEVGLYRLVVMVMMINSGRSVVHF